VNIKEQKKYEKWCLGKHIDGELIVAVELTPFVYGSVVVITETGKRYFLPQGADEFKPTKRNLWRLIDEYKK